MRGGGGMVWWGFMDWAAAERVLGCVEVGEEKVKAMDVFGTLVEACLGVGRVGRRWFRGCYSCGREDSKPTSWYE